MAWFSKNFNVFFSFPKLILRHGRQIVLILVIIGGNHKYNFNGEEVIFVPLLMTFQLLAAFQTLDFLQLEAEFIFSLSLRLALCFIDLLPLSAISKDVILVNVTTECFYIVRK